MHLYMVHCGFYDRDLAEGVYESHVNYFVVAEDPAGAKRQVKKIDEFLKKKMHVDGLQEIRSVDGFDIQLVPNFEMGRKSSILNVENRELS